MAWRLKLSATSLLFNGSFKGTSKKTSQLCTAGPLWGESTGDRWIPLTKGQQYGKHSHDVTLSWKYSSTHNISLPRLLHAYSHFDTSRHVDSRPVPSRSQCTAQNPVEWNLVPHQRQRCQKPCLLLRIPTSCTPQTQLRHPKGRHRLYPSCPRRESRQCPHPGPHCRLVELKMTQRCMTTLFKYKKDDCSNYVFR